MPSPKTAEKTIEKLIKVKALRKFGVEYTQEELKNAQSGDRENRSFKGMTHLIEVGKTAEISKKDAEKLQDSGVVKIIL